MLGDVKRHNRLEDRAWLYRQYWEEGKNQQEIADMIGRSNSSVSLAMQRMSIPTRHNHSWHPTYTTIRGRPRIHVDGHRFHVHKAIALAKGHSIEEVFSEGTAVHHVNGLPWDNRPENIQVMDDGEHTRLHNMVENREFMLLACEP